MLVLAVEVHGDRARADVHALADIGVAHVAEVVHLRALPETCGLHLAEIAHPDALLEVGARPEVRVRADAHIVLERGAFEHRGLDDTASADGRVPQDRVRPDTRVRADGRRALEHAAAVDDDVRGDADGVVDGRRVGIAERHAVEHQPFPDPAAQDRFRGGELDPRVHAHPLTGVGRAERGDRPAGVDRRADDVGEEDLAGRVGPERVDGAAQPGEIERVRAEVRFGKPQLLSRREASLHDPAHVAAGVSDHPTVRVVRPDRRREQRDGRPALRPERAKAVERGRAQRRCVAVQHEDLAVALVGGLGRHTDRVAGPPHPLLHGHRGVGRQDRPGLVEDVRRQDDDRPGARAERRVDRPADEGLPGAGVQDLGDPGAHALALSRGEHECELRRAHLAGATDQRSGWGARIRTWDRGSKVLCLTTWPRPIVGRAMRNMAQV